MFLSTLLFFSTVPSQLSSILASVSCIDDIFVVTPVSSAHDDAKPWSVFVSVSAVKMRNSRGASTAP